MHANDYGLLLEVGLMVNDFCSVVPDFVKLKSECQVKHISVAN